VAGAFDNIMDKEWINRAIDAENQKYLPMVPVEQESPLI
jgi:hypothetical protein